MKKLILIAITTSLSMPTLAHHHHGGFGTGVAVGAAVGTVVGAVASAVASPTVVTPAPVVTTPVVYQSTYVAPPPYAPTGVLIPNYTVSGTVVYKDPGPYYSPYVPRYYGGCSPYVRPAYRPPVVHHSFHGGYRPVYGGPRPGGFYGGRPGGHHRR